MYVFVCNNIKIKRPSGLQYKIHFVVYVTIFLVLFKPHQVDTVIIQAICLLDALDKELNTYALQVREWYG